MINQAKIHQLELKEQYEARLAQTLFPKKKLKNKQMALSSLNRVNNWAKEKLSDEDTMKVLKSGIMPLIHPENHDFRAPANGEKLPSSTNFYVRNYLPDAQRAETSCQEYKSSHLAQAPYTPPKHYVERERDLPKESGPTFSPRFGVRTENQRLKEFLGGPNRLIDNTLADNKMIYYPDWRDGDKTKWTAKKEFDLTTCHYQGMKSRDPWKMHEPVGLCIGDKYVDGFEVTGDLSRKRNKVQELASKDFLTTVTPHRGSQGSIPPLVSDSLRTNKASTYIKEGENKKIYANTIRYFTPKDAYPSPTKTGENSPQPVVAIHIKTGGMDPMKESLVSDHTRSSSPHRGKSFDKTGFSSSKRSKNSSMGDRSEYIKQTVKEYFDQL